MDNPERTTVFVTWSCDSKYARITPGMIPLIPPPSILRIVMRFPQFGGRTFTWLRVRPVFSINLLSWRRLNHGGYSWDPFHFRACGCWQAQIRIRVVEMVHLLKMHMISVQTQFIYSEIFCTRNWLWFSCALGTSWKELTWCFNNCEHIFDILLYSFVANRPPPDHLNW